MQFATQPYRDASGYSSGYSRLEEATQAFVHLREIQGLRLIPEFRMHVARLCALAQDVGSITHNVENLRDWFTRDNHSYQLDLLTVQQLTLSTITTAGLFALDDAEMWSRAESINEHMQFIRDAPTAVGDRYYSTAVAMRRHQNPYWYARGLAATCVIGMVTEREKAWRDPLWNEFVEAATAIGRVDWIDNVAQYGDTNLGLWLLGY
jgi:hypothetical protein